MVTRKLEFCWITTMNGFNLPMFRSKEMLFQKRLQINAAKTTFSPICNLRIFTQEGPSIDNERSRTNHKTSLELEVLVNLNAYSVTVFRLRGGTCSDDFNLLAHPLSLLFLQEQQQK
jgi:hypothetical protein